MLTFVITDWTTFLVINVFACKSAVNCNTESSTVILDFVVKVSWIVDEVQATLLLSWTELLTSTEFSRLLTSKVGNEGILEILLEY